MNKRVMIFGNSGAGKSTLAKQFKADHGLAHLDLDPLAWQQSKPPKRNPLDVSRLAIEAFIEKHKGWVIEGCYGDLLGMVSVHANLAVFMNLPVSDCQDNAKNRPWEPHKYQSKAEQDANLAMLLDWIAQYETREDVFSLQAHQVLYDQFTGTKYRIEKNQQTMGEIRALEN